MAGMIESFRWWVVAILPKSVATWLWNNEWIPLGGWAPYVLGQSLGRRGKPIASGRRVR